MVQLTGDVPAWLHDEALARFHDAPEAHAALGSREAPMGETRIHLVRMPRAGAALLEVTVYPSGHVAETREILRFPAGGPAPTVHFGGDTLETPDGPIQLGVTNPDLPALLEETAQWAAKLPADEAPRPTAPLVDPKHGACLHGEILDPALTIRSLIPLEPGKVSGEFATLERKVLLLDASALRDGVYLTLRDAEALRDARLVLEPGTLKATRRDRGQAQESLRALLEDTHLGRIHPLKVAPDLPEEDPVRRLLQVASLEGAVLVTTDPATVTEALLVGVPVLEADKVAQKRPEPARGRERKPAGERPKRPRRAYDPDRILQGEVKGRTESGNLHAEYRGKRVIFPKTKDLDLAEGSPVKFRITRQSGEDFLGDFVVT